MHVNVRSVDVGRVGVCMLCVCANDYPWEWVVYYDVITIIRGSGLFIMKQ